MRPMFLHDLIAMSDKQRCIALVPNSQRLIIAFATAVKTSVIRPMLSAGENTIPSVIAM